MNLSHEDLGQILAVAYRQGHLDSENGVVRSVIDFPESLDCLRNSYPLKSFLGLRFHLSH